MGRLDKRNTIIELCFFTNEYYTTKGKLLLQLQFSLLHSVAYLTEYFYDIDITQFKYYFLGGCWNPKAYLGTLLRVLTIIGDKCHLLNNRPMGCTRAELYKSSPLEILKSTQRYPSLFDSDEDRNLVWGAVKDFWLKRSLNFTFYVMN